MLKWVAASVALLVGLIVIWDIFLPNRGNNSNILASLKAEEGVRDDDSTVFIVHRRRHRLPFRNQRGKIASQDGMAIYSPEPDLISYAPEGDTSPAASLVNRIQAPRGNKNYEVVLPDGSKVWLNAASSIGFPISFEGDVRRVKLEGEAYFEVVKNVGKPFIVSIGKADIKVKALPLT